MSYRYRNKRKKYRIKPVPIIILILLAVISAAFVLFVLQDRSGAKAPSSGLPSEPSTGASSNTISEEIPSEPQTSLAQSSEDDELDANGQGGEVSLPEANLPQSSLPQSSETGSVVMSPSTSTQVADAISGRSVFTELWNLNLVNRSYPLGKDMSIKKTKFDSQYVDSRAADAYKAMYDAAKQSGITLFLRSGYRSVSEQTANYNAAINRYISQGNSKEKAIELTEQYYARPGESEHHTGLAFDIITPEYHSEIYSLDERFAQTDAFAWLQQNAESYGFILRFPKSKEAVTGIAYEPWHYRYVGIDHAKAINRNGWCLEEYIAKMNDSFVASASSQYPDGGNADQIRSVYYEYARKYPSLV